MNIEDREFILEGFYKDDFNTYIENLNLYLAGNNLPGLLDSSILPNKSVRVVFKEVCSGGVFINFCGMEYNTESGYLCLGYNGNKDSYIPVVSLVDILTQCCCPKNNIIGISEVNYIVETIKLWREVPDIYGYIVGLIRKQGKGKSIIANYINQKEVVLNDLRKTSDIFITSNDDFFALVGEVITKIIGYVDHLFGLVFGGDSDIQMNYIAGLFKDGIDPTFLRELSSVGLGVNKRDSLLKDRSSNPARYLLLLSSGAYIDTWDSVSFSNINMKKIKAYNIIDLLRGLGREQDLYFSYTMVSLYKEPKFILNLIKRLDIMEDIESDVGMQSFMESIKDYARNMSVLVDRGSYRTTQVKDQHVNLIAYSVKGTLGAGKVVDKLLNRIVSKF